MAARCTGGNRRITDVIVGKGVARATNSQAQTPASTARITSCSSSFTIHDHRQKDENPIDPGHSFLTSPIQESGITSGSAIAPSSVAE